MYRHYHHLLKVFYSLNNPKFSIISQVTKKFNFDCNFDSINIISPLKVFNYWFLFIIFLVSQKFKMPRPNTIVVMSLFFVALTHVVLGGKIIDRISITYQNKIPQIQDM